MTHAEKAILAYDMTLLEKSEAVDFLLKRVTRFSRLSSILIVTGACTLAAPYAGWLYGQIDGDPLLASLIAFWAVLVMVGYLTGWITYVIYALRPGYFFKGYWSSKKGEASQRMGLLRAIVKEAGPLQQFATLAGLKLEAKKTIIDLHDGKRVGSRRYVALIKNVQSILDYNEAHEAGAEAHEFQETEKRFGQIAEIYSAMQRRADYV